MDIWYFLMELVLLLGGAFLLGALAQRFRQSPILGYILAGAIVGPLLFNASAVNQAAELGVSLLLFSIGLEFSFQQIRKRNGTPDLFGGCRPGRNLKARRHFGCLHGRSHCARPPYVKAHHSNDSSFKAAIDHRGALPLQSLSG